MTKRILTILTEGFEEIEAVTPIDLLRRAEFEVVLASRTEALEIKGRNGIVLKAETTLDAVAEQEFDAILLPGGPGTEQLREDPRVLELVKSYAKQGKLVAAICAAPSVLAKAGLLEDKRWTAHFSVHDSIDGTPDEAATVTDGNLITSQGAGTALSFGFAIISWLSDADRAEKVADSICLR